MNLAIDRAASRGQYRNGGSGAARRGPRGGAVGMVSDLTPSQALELWRRVLIANLRVTGGDLSARQLALLLTVYMTPAPRTVRGLADFLDISTPAVTRALYRLNKLGVLRRKLDKGNRRRIVVHRTVKGAVFLRDFADLVAATARALDQGETPAG